MNFTKESFGQIGNQDVFVFKLKNDNGMQVSCLNYGCVITEILVPDKNGVVENVVLGFDTLEGYLKDSPYFGAVCGRVAGRIKGASFELNEQTYKLAQNNGRNHLHGGEKGYHDVVWSAEALKVENGVAAEFHYISKDGEEGYPGEVDIKVSYTLTNKNELLISYEAISDQTTLFNVTNHSYFNLSGNLKRDILDHLLTLKSNQYIELDDELLPTGNINSVEGTPFDFQDGKKLKVGVEDRHSQLILVGKGYDHPFLLNAHHQQEIVLSDKESGRKLTIETAEPAVVVYSGNQLSDDFTIRGVQSKPYLGICLETQGVPDAIHHPHFPSVTLEKNRTYTSKTKYTFSS